MLITETTMRLVNELGEIDNELREVEDDYLETWLEEGMPDGTTTGQVLDDYLMDMSDWVKLGKKLLKMREENPEED